MVPILPTDDFGIMADRRAGIEISEAGMVGRALHRNCKTRRMRPIARGGSRRDVGLAIADMVQGDGLIVRRQRIEIDRRPV